MERRVACYSVSQKRIERFREGQWNKEINL